MSEDNSPLYKEQHRPQFHFSPEKNWLNDPNGLVFIDGVYHLFYQHNPKDKVWGNMCWGHATSRDLMHWQHQPLAIEMGGNEDDFIFSGSAIYDQNNTSGLGSKDNPPILAFFTWSGERSQNQRQAIAYSLDKGHAWQLYQHNPIIDNPGIKDFRDPKVFWYELGEMWVMLIAAGQSIRLYTSSNLIDWSFSSSFGQWIGRHGGDWECPDLFALKVENKVDSGHEKVKWVMLVSVSPGAPNGGCATQYFVGEFDGFTFVADETDSRWIDWGPDSFAGQTWSMPSTSSEKIYLAWMSNWLYANNTPTTPWRGQMTLPRTLSLRGSGQHLLLCSQPYPAVELLRCNPIPFDIGAKNTVPELHDGFVEVQLSTGALAGLRFFNEQEECVYVLFDMANQRLIVDRHQTLNRPDFPQYAFSYYADLPETADSTFTLRWLKDASSIELFINHGELVMSALLYSQSPLDHLECYQYENGDKKTPLKNSTVQFSKPELYPLSSIWQMPSTDKVHTKESIHE